MASNIDKAAEAEIAQEIARKDAFEAFRKEVSVLKEVAVEAYSLLSEVSQYYILDVS